MKPRIWTRQPATPQRVNRSTEAGAAITTLIPLGFDNRDVVSGKQITIGSGGSIYADNRGLSLKGSGSATVANIALDLTAYSKLSISFWLYWDAYANDYDMAMEYGTGAGSAGEFYISPNYSGGTNWEIAVFSLGGNANCRFVRPSAAAWHHYVINIETGVVGGVRSVYVDSVSQSLTTANTPTGNLANKTLNILNRNSASLFGAGRMQNLVLRAGYTMSQAEALDEYTRPFASLYAPIPGRRRAFSIAAGGTHTTTGALSSAAATVAGTATHLTLHPSTGALSSAAATVAGTAAHKTLHATTGALSSAAATVAGTAVHPHTTTGALSSAAATISGTADNAAAGDHATTGALSAAAASVSGTAVHKTLHATTGALSAAAATVAGTAAHLTLHTTTGALQAASATVSGSAREESTYVATRPQGGGRSSKPRKRVFEVNGQDIVVNSTEEAQALIDRLKDEAKAKAALAIQRATSAQKRKPRKVIADARRLLEVPEITAPDELQSYAARAVSEIEDLYRSTLMTVEISAMLSRQQQLEEDDEEVLLLLV